MYNILKETIYDETLWFILYCYQFIVIDAFVKLAVIFYVIFVKTSDLI